MASLSIRDLDDGIRDRLKIRAAANGRSMEAEVRAILSEALGGEDRSAGLLGALSARVGDIGGVELEVPARSEKPRAADLS